jgi:hypothetical protein
LDEGTELLEAVMAEYRNEEMGLSCTTNFNILKITGKRLIDGTITHSVVGQQLSESREEVEKDLVKNLAQLEEMRLGLIKASPDL